MINVLDLLTTF